ncbi:MAG: SDR family oxidoreductase, partial [Clostridiales bacterium]
RIILLKGDISIDLLGLQESIYKKLSVDIDCIINSAADVRHYGDYNELYKVNVKGVENLLLFAQNIKAKNFNHISTISVSHKYCEKNKKLIFSEDNNIYKLSSENNYVNTKQKAEEIINKARQKGLKCNIFRVGNLIFDSKKGTFQENINTNHFFNTIKSFIKIEALPSIEIKFDFSFIDYVSNAIVLLFNINLDNENYHIINHNYVNILKLADLLNIDLLEKEEFVNYLSLIFKNKSVDDKYLGNIVKCIIELLESEKHRFCIESKKTILILEKMGFIWSDINKNHIEKMIKYFKKVKYL